MGTARKKVKACGIGGFRVKLNLMAQYDVQKMILAEGSGWLAIDKPAGLSVHNDPVHGDVLSVLSAGFKNRTFFPVHRLDAPTSGVLLLATAKSVATELAGLFAGRDIHKNYLCGVKGFPGDRGTWNFPLTDKAEGRKNPAGLAGDRKPAVTNFKVLQRTAYFSLLQIELETGYTHQIRKHAALAHFPVLGDTRYGNESFVRVLHEKYDWQGLALHSSRLAFKWKGEDLVLQAPLPISFRKLFPVGPESRS
jgi:RluA family pseudouridine synthase